MALTSLIARLLPLQIYRYYTDKSGRMMGFDELEAFATEFSLLPRLVSKPLLFRIFRTISPQQRPIFFIGFIECVGRIALMGLESMNDTLPTPKAKFASLIERLHVTPKLDVITKEAHERGLGDGLDVDSDSDADDYRGTLSSRGRRTEGFRSMSPQVLVRASRRRQRSYMKALSPYGVGHADRDSASVASSSVASSGIMAQLMEAAFDRDSVVSGSTYSSVGSRRMYRRSVSTPTRLYNSSSGRRTASASPQLGASPGPPSAKGEIVVSSTLAEAVARKLLPEFQDKILPVFQFYCRIGDPSNDGQMSLSNFIRLIQDCEATDDLVSISMIDVQLAIIVQRRRRLSGSAAMGEEAHRIPKLDLKQFVEGLVRVSQLISLACGPKPSEAAAGSSSGSMGLGSSSSPGGVADADFSSSPAFADAVTFARSFVVTRVLPLSVLAVAEEETIQMLQQPDVALCMSAPDNERFLTVRCCVVVLH